MQTGSLCSLSLKAPDTVVLQDGGAIALASVGVSVAGQSISPEADTQQHNAPDFPAVAFRQEGSEEISRVPLSLAAVRIAVTSTAPL